MPPGKQYSQPSPERAFSEKYIYIFREKLIAISSYFLHTLTDKNAMDRAVQEMANTIVGTLAGDAAPKSYLMTTVTSDCVVIRNPSAAWQTAISLSRLSDVQTVKSSSPALLVIAMGLSLISAAAFCSKEGDGAGFPAAVFGAVFVAGYLFSRKAAINFMVDWESTQTQFGTPNEAKNLKKAVQAACNQEPSPEKHSPEQPVELTPGLPGLLTLRAEGANS